MPTYKKSTPFHCKRIQYTKSLLLMLLVYVCLMPESWAYRSIGGGSCGGNCDSCKEFADKMICSLPYIIKDPLISDILSVNPQGVEQCVVSPVCHYCYDDDYYLGYGECSEDLFALGAPLDNGECKGEGNPCNPATGNKFQTEIDYRAAAFSGLSFIRYYNSQNVSDNQFTVNWRHNYSSAMNQASTPLESESFPDARGGPGSSTLSNYYNTAAKACLEGWEDIKLTALRGLLADAVTVYEGGNLCRLYLNGDWVAMLTVHTTSKSQTIYVPPPQIQMLTRANGHTHYFEQQDGLWQDRFNSRVKLEELQDGWLFTDRQDLQEIYSANGQLQSIISRGGKETTLIHDLDVDSGGDGDSETLDRVTGPFGRTLGFSYNENGKLTQVSTPDGVVSYDYDNKENLSAVHYPGESYREYHYEDTRFLHHLTGITDENRNRYSTWAYDDQGRSILSEHANGTERVEFTYNADGSTTVKDALGATRTYQFEVIKGNLEIRQITGDQCVTCRNGYMKTRSYDSNGFLSGYTDWQSNVTRFETDSRGLQTCRLEGYGTSDVRSVHTIWHTDFRVPVRVDIHAPASAEEDYNPVDCAFVESSWKRLKTTRYLYDELGRLLSQTSEAP